MRHVLQFHQPGGNLTVPLLRLLVENFCFVVIGPSMAELSTGLPGLAGLGEGLLLSMTTIGLKYVQEGTVSHLAQFMPILFLPFYQARSIFTSFISPMDPSGQPEKTQVRGGHTKAEALATMSNHRDRISLV